MQSKKGEKYLFYSTGGIVLNILIRKFTFIFLNSFLHKKFGGIASRLLSLYLTTNNLKELKTLKVL